MPINAYQADLHIHTILSPCAEVEMLPSLIIAAAQMAGLDIIGIADHNSCENAEAVIEASAETGVRVLPGLEIQSVEGVHLLCLFDSIDQAASLQDSVYANLPNVQVDDKTLSQQMAVDSLDEFIGYCEWPLSLPTLMEIDEIYEKVNALNGIIIPSHIDRRGTGICGVLGMLPESPSFIAVEISANMTPEQARSMQYGIGDKAILQNSDAHWLSMIGDKRTTLYLEHRSIDEIKKACKRENGRRVANA